MLAWLLASFSQIVYVALLLYCLLLFVLGRAVGTSENQGVLSSCNLLLLVEIGFTDLPKSGGVMTPPAPPAPTGLAAATVRD